MRTWMNCAASASLSTLPNCLQFTTLNVSLNMQVNPIHFSFTQYSSTRMPYSLSSIHFLHVPWSKNTCTQKKKKKICIKKEKKKRVHFPQAAWWQLQCVAACLCATCAITGRVSGIAFIPSPSSAVRLAACAPFINRLLFFLQAAAGIWVNAGSVKLRQRASAPWMLFLSQKAPRLDEIKPHEHNSQTFLIPCHMILLVSAYNCALVYDNATQ